MALSADNQRITISRNIPDMTAVAKTHSDTEMQRAEMRAVLSSELFTRAPTLAHLLEYLCEKTFAGESSQIKEYSVGIDVFHRGPEFDQDSDSIVRVQANRLRKRLAEYYTTEGATHALRLTIPVGQYVPVFEESAGSEPSAREVSDDVPNPAVSPRRSLATRKPALIGVGAVLVLVLLAGVVLWIHRTPPTAVISGGFACQRAANRTGRLAHGG